MTEVFIVAVSLVIAVTGILYFLDRKNPRVSAVSGEDGAMPSASRRILIAYLLVVGAGLVYMLASLAAADFPDTPFQLSAPSPPPKANEPSPAIVKPTSTIVSQPAELTMPLEADVTAGQIPDGGKPPGGDAGTPILKDVFPQTTLDSQATNFVTVLGYGFVKEKTVVRFNRQRRRGDFLSAELIKAQLQPEDLKEGSMIVDAANGDRVSNSIVVTVGKPRVPVNVFGVTRYITRENQLLLLVIFAGALGSYIHALKSLADFIGNRAAIASWFWWYITRPFLGAAMALIFYAVLRGGFMAGTPADANAVNPFGVIAIGALVGLFADKAGQKLAEIFDTLFTTPDNRSGKLVVPVIDSVEPSTVRLMALAGITLKGDRLGKVVKIRLNNEDRPPDTVSEKEVTLKLREKDVKESRAIKVTAVNPDQGVSPAVTIHVSDLDINMPSALPGAEVGKEYSQKLTATGGSGLYSWRLDGPTWLSIKGSDTLTGTPPSAGTVKVVAQVTDETGASVSKELDLKTA
jgi:hypothetical protein